MVVRLIAMLVALAVVLGGCGSDSDGESSTASLEHAGYLDARSSSVVAIDLRWDGDNWDDLKPLVERILGEYRERLPAGERDGVPADVDAAAKQLVNESTDLTFEGDVEPALDGHLLIGVTARPEKNATPTIEVVYRTEGGDLSKLADRLAGGAETKRVPGHDDAITMGTIGLVGKKTLMTAFGTVDGEGHVKGMLDRQKDGQGFAAERLAEAEGDAGLDDPLILATGDLTLASTLVGADELERAREAFPYLKALRRASAALDVGDDTIEAKGRLVTDGAPLTERDLPVAPAGEVELPSADELIAGGSRNQSHTTTFATRLARALLPDSRFVKAVEAAERDLGVKFEDEVLRQFDCPSVSVLEPPTANEPEGSPRFGARSCVDDPERMRELLPRLRPHLPDILVGLQGLGEQGLTALLLLAPDAPLTPGGPLAQIRVTPFDEGAAGETLYEIDGLRDDDALDAPRVGPDKIVFGLIGDAFVVASDTEMARGAAKLETETIDREAGSALRIPIRELLLREDDPYSKALAEVFGTLLGTVTADPKATTGEATLELRD